MERQLGRLVICELGREAILLFRPPHQIHTRHSKGFERAARVERRWGLGIQLAVRPSPSHRDATQLVLALQVELRRSGRVRGGSEG